MSTAPLQGSSNADYHANRSHLSSSQLKVLLKDPAQFYKEVVLGVPELRVESNALTEGTFVHSLILEPHKVITDYAVFDGLRKAGQKYDDFVAANPGKTIVSVAQVMRCEKLLHAFQKHTAAKALITGGEAEHTMVQDLQSVPCKARADYILPARYIVDVKTTAMPSDKELFKETVTKYGYELSASLYKSIADKLHGAEHEFYWLVLSKADFQCRVYKASAKTLTTGAQQVSKALELYKHCMATGVWLSNAVAPAQALDELYNIEEV